MDLNPVVRFFRLGCPEEGKAYIDLAWSDPLHGTLLTLASFFHPQVRTRSTRGVRIHRSATLLGLD